MKQARNDQLDIFAGPAPPARPARDERGAPPPLPLPDRAARDAIARELDANLLVEAGAGAGKTTEMVTRMLALVTTGHARVEQLAAVTFTRKAASELRERFQERLEGALRAASADGDGERAARIRDALHGIDRAFLGTIHAFCARLLRERPLEAGLDPAFRELTAAEELRLRRAFWRVHLERLSAADDRSLIELREVGLSTGRVYPVYELMCRFPDVEFPADPVPPPETAPLRAEVDRLLGLVDGLLPDVEPAGGWDALMQCVRRLRFRRWRGWDDDVTFLEALADAFASTPRAVQRRWSDDARVRARVGDIGRQFAAFTAEGGSGHAALREWRAHRYPIAIAFARTAARAFAEERRATGVLVFEDLLLHAARLLKRSPRARRALGERYRFLLVDEFQDTDPVQAEVLLLLASEPRPDEAPADWRTCVPRPGALFVVGDPKQSIYRFRRADIAVYTQVRERFHGFGRVLELTANFRSQPPIAQLANTAFATLFPQQASPEQAPFAPLDVQRKDDPHARVAWYTLPDRSRADEVAALDAPMLAAWIDARIRNGERAPGDFIILARRKRHLALYARALEGRGVPAQVTGTQVEAEEEMRELLLLLGTLADPADATRVVAVLTGLFFGLDYEQLAGHVLDRGGRFGIQHPPAAIQTDVDHALETLHTFWRWTREEPADVALARIVEALGLVPFAAASPLGAGRTGALLFAIDTVRQAALAGDASLTGAIDAIETALASDDAEAPLEPGRTDVVRLMTVHQAKGLEAEVVILSDAVGGREFAIGHHIARGPDGQPTGWATLDEHRNFTRRPFARPLDWERHEAAERAFETAEAHRLVYVAATRARSELIVARPYGPQPAGPWQPLYAVLERDFERIELPAAMAVEPPPALATLADVQAAIARADRARAWAAIPTYQAVAVTARVKAGDIDLAGVRGRGPDWGTAVHGTLDAAARGAHGETLRESARSLLLAAERPAGTDGEPLELDELVELVHGVLASPLWTRARRAALQGRLLSEAGFALAVDGDTLRTMLTEAGAPADAQRDTAPVEIVEGIVDLAFRDDDGWTIVDYKSDAAGKGVPVALLARYRAQLGLYAAAWRRATGEPVARRILLFTATGETDEV